MNPDDEPPGAEATLYAEQALLGGLLLAPERLPHIPATLRPEHFYRPVHSALYAAMLHLADRQHPATGPNPTKEDGFAWLNDTVTRGAQDSSGLTPVYAHTLIAACPRTDHLPAYARMVLASHARRTVTEHATRLAQISTANAANNAGVEHTCALADTLATVLDDLTTQWRPHPGSLPRRPAPPVPAASPSDSQMDNELMFLGTAATRPEELTDIRTWLNAEDFTHPAHAELYRCLTALHHRGDPIDPLTVLWEAQHRGALNTTTALTPEHIRTICDWTAGAPGYWAEHILQHSLLTTAARTAHHINHLAADPTLTPHQLITGARRALGDLTTIRIRWHHAHDDTPPAKPPRPRHRPPPAASPAPATPRPPRSLQTPR